MSTEATLEEWKKLYELAKEFKKRKPWLQLANLDIMELKLDGEETAYLTVLGDGGEIFGFSLYVGDDALNKLRMIACQEELAIDTQLVLYEQDCINMTIGGRDDLDEEQYELIRALRERFRGNGWIYFKRFEPGMYPVNLNKKEVEICTKYLQLFLDKTKEKRFIEPIEPEDLLIENVHVTDESLKHNLKNAPSCNETWELDFYPMFNNIAEHEEYEKPIVVGVCLIAKHDDGERRGYKTITPREYQKQVMQTFADSILKYGKPNKIVVQNRLLEAMIKDICEICSIEIGFAVAEFCWQEMKNLERHLEEPSGMLSELLRNIDVSAFAEEMTEEEMEQKFKEAMRKAMANMKNEGSD